MSYKMNQEPGGVGSKPFDGIRFVLLGFDYDAESEIRLKLVSGGGEDAGSYSPDCTHVIVDKCVYDDTTCVAARRDGKIVVSSLWVDHSYDIGMPVDHNTVIYRPLKHLNGIPGAKKLVICLTGYQRQDREDIMIMVSLIGAEFSKPLVASRATHLICYKFEGEKYELAKKLPTIKLVNHTWLEDCLNTWELLPEEHYAKSGYELEMEAEVKDSDEDDVEGSITKQFNGRINNVSLDTRMANGVVSTLLPTHSISKVSLSPAAAVRVDSTKESNVLNKDNKAKFIPVCDNNLDLVIDARRNDVVRHEHSNQSMDTLVDKKGLEPICHDIVEKSEYLVPSPCKEKKSASSDTSCSVKGAKILPESSLKISNITHAMKSSQRSSLRKDLVDETRCSDKQLGKLLDSDPLASFSEIGLKSESGNMKTSKATSVSRKEVIFNVLPSKRKQGDICDSVTAQKSSSSRSSIVLTDYIEVTVPEHLPGVIGDNVDAHSTNSITAEKHMLDIMTSSPGLMLAKSDDPHRGRQSTEPRQKTKSKTRLNLVSGSPNSSARKAENQTDKNLMNSGNKIFKSKARGKKGIGKKTTESNLSCEAPSNDTEIGKSKEPHMLVEESNKPIAKPSKKQTNKDSVGTRVKAAAKAVSKKCVLTVTKNSSMEPSNGEEKGNILDAFPKCSLNKADSSIDDCVELERLDSFGFIKDFEGACCPIDDETENPGRESELEANTTRAVIEDREIETDLQPGYKSCEKNTVLTPSFPGIVECNVIEKKIFQENESDRSAMKINAKRNKTNNGTTNQRKSKKVAKTTAGIKKIEPGRAEFNDQPVVKTKGRTLQIPNSSAEKHNIDANRLKDVFESKKENRSLLDYAEVGNMNDSFFHLPNNNAQNISADGNKLKNTPESEKENKPLPDAAGHTSFTTVTGPENASTSGKRKANVMKTYLSNKVSSQMFSMNELKFFLLSGHLSERNELKKMVRQLKGRLCRDSHQWSYQTTHFIVPKPVRTEKFFAAAASGRWILKPDYLTNSLKAGKFLDEEPYEWYSNDHCQVGKVDLVAPRKWRIMREQTGHGAFHGMRIIVYGDFFCPPLDTLKRVVKAGDGIVLATAPPYTRFLNSQVDFAIISQGTPKEDAWVQEFLKHEIPCVAIDYLVEFVCKPGSPLKEHVMFETDSFAEKSFANTVRRSQEIIEDLVITEEEDLNCNVCGSRDRGEQMLICGDEEGSVGCGIGTHADCCDPPLKEIPEDDWFCSKCSISKLTFVKSKKRSSDIKDS